MTMGLQSHLRRRPIQLLWALAGAMVLACVLKALAGSGSEQARAAEPARASAAASARAARLPAGRPLTIAWGGDTTLGSSFGVPGDHGFQALAPIARTLRAADLSAVNSEGTFATGGSSKCGASNGKGSCFAFRAPPGNAAALARAGVDVVNLANNHAWDFGADGMGQSVRALRGHGVQVTGRPDEIRVESLPGARVAFVGFASYRWSSPILDLAHVRALVKRAVTKANVVVAFFHGGAEGSDRIHVPLGSETYLGEDRGDLRAFAHTAVDAGADLVLGSGPHVLRGIERYKQRLIAYSLGNLAGFHNFATGGVLSQSGILRVTLGADGRAIGGRFSSLLLDGADIPHTDASGQAARTVSALSKADFGTGGVTVASGGALSFPGSVALRSQP